MIEPRWNTKAPKQDVDVDIRKRRLEKTAEYEAPSRVELIQTEQKQEHAIDEIIQKEIIEEANKAAPPIKKAGGTSSMLGE